MAAEEKLFGLFWLFYSSSCCFLLPLPLSSSFVFSRFSRECGSPAVDSLGFSFIVYPSLSPSFGLSCFSRESGSWRLFLVPPLSSSFVLSFFERVWESGSREPRRLLRVSLASSYEGPREASHGGSGGTGPPEEGIFIVPSINDCVLLDVICWDCVLEAVHHYLFCHQRLCFIVFC